MKKNLFAIFALCCFLHIEAVEKEPVRIMVQESDTRTVVPYASVFVKTVNDSTLIAGSTDKEGLFQLKKIRNNDYKLQVTAVGYLSLDTIVSLNDDHTCTLYLNPSLSELGEVSVVYTRKAYEQKYDRKVYTVTEAQQATARNVFDLLKTLPGVVVNDENKSVMYRGNTPQMQVNDLPAEFLYPDLSVIPAEKVRKIELIDASNRGGGIMGGIINILLVKPGKEGIDGILSSELKQGEISHSFAQEHVLNLNYGLGKNVIFGNFLYTDANNHDLNSRSGYSVNSITGKEEILQTDTARRNNRKFQATLGAIRNIDSLRTDFYVLGVAAVTDRSTGNNFTRRGDMEYFLNSGKHGYRYGVGAGYGIVKKFTQSDRMFQFITYVNTPIWGNGKGTSRYLYPDATALDISGKSRVNGTYGMINIYYNHPLPSGWNLSVSENSQLEASSTGSDMWQNGELDVLNLTRDKQINWNDNLSLNIGRSADKIRLEGGLSFNHRYNTHDYTRYMVVEHDSTFANRKHFFSVCPSVNFNWHISETNDLSAKYSYSQNFPNIDDFTDYVDKRGIYSWKTGNPSLRSARYHNVALGFTYSKDTYNFSSELVYKQSNNDIVSIGYYLPDNIRLFKPVNVGRTQDLGVIFTNWIRLSSKVSMTNSATLNYKSLDQSNLKKEANAFGLDGEKFVFTQFNYDINSYITWSINKRNFASIRMNFYSKSLQYYGYRRPWFNSSINYTCKLLKDDRLKLMFGIDNLTYGLIDRIAVNNNMGTYTTAIEDPSSHRRTFKIALTYIFNKGDKGTKNIKF